MYKIKKNNYLRTFLLIMITLNNISIHTINIVHVIGDSHSLFGFSNISLINRGMPLQEISYFRYKNKSDQTVFVPFFIHKIGSITMHRIGRDGLYFFNVKKYSVKKNDIVVFSFGEIDVRCHIGKQRDQKERDLDEIIEILVTNYINTIVKNRELYSNLYCVVFAILPPTNKPSEPSYPIYGSLEDRITITKKLNTKLKEECNKNNIAVLDVYDLYSTKQGYLNPKLSDGKVHIKKKYNRPVKLRLIKLINKTWEKANISLSLEELITAESALSESEDAY